MLKSLGLIALLALSVSCIHVHKQRLPGTNTNGTIGPIPGGLSPNSFSGGNTIGPLPGGLSPNGFSGGNSGSSISSSCGPLPSTKQDRCLNQVGTSFRGKSGSLNNNDYTGGRIIVCYNKSQCAAQRSDCRYSDFCANSAECNFAVDSYLRAGCSVSLYRLP